MLTQTCSPPISPYHIALNLNEGSRFFLSNLAKKWQLIDQPDCLLVLSYQSGRLELTKADEPKQGPVYVDFVEGVLKHRRQFGGGRGEAVAKACGIKGNYLPSIIDATAGLGRDAFVLASLGCEVKLLERHPVVAALLEDGLTRAYQDSHIGDWMQVRMQQIIPTEGIKESQTLLTTLQPADVVYLDPMYPHPEHKKQTALVKKEMRVFQYLVGADVDADTLLPPALALAKKRVVVKRADYAPVLNGQSPQGFVKTKNHRFDIYSKVIE
ncbi:class I SAM-dependent methyltransferase [Thorsellia anophelis]|uniref:Ribosomal RNA small subunit methyltransferase J n=1 Tax=Thorsellia anophelis DSM 18579 TaxID=1123402 RepID=A0A1I0DPU0_9GAMM|nr:class I SAM-dependent methyltransferase [Thorsellia anophelis]SET34552.1 16S rRNA (guanine1516-N2)-methyltransferase [Thorsellia anophelis DSM 18579]